MLDCLQSGKNGANKVVKTMKTWMNLVVKPNEWVIETSESCDWEGLF